VTRVFRDRQEAGEALAREFLHASRLPDPIILALPRGGVPVGWEIARALAAPLDVLLVRKLGVPGQPELAMGAIASGGVRVMSPEVLAVVQPSDREVERVVAEETLELDRRERIYRGDRPRPEVRGRNVILVDDGVATGSSMLAAIRALRALEPAAIVVAVPVAPPDTWHRLKEEADALVCLLTPEPFHAISLWYESFPQLSDTDVRAILDRQSVDRQRRPGVKPDPTTPEPDGPSGSPRRM